MPLRIVSTAHETLVFLSQLAQHNNREWFYQHKKAYELAKAQHEALIADLLSKVAEFEDLTGVQVKDCTFRINRAVRFSANKSPYKWWFAASIAEGGRKSNKQSYYLHIQPGDQSFIGGGMYAPTAEQLAALRQEIDYNPESLKSVIEDWHFKAYFGEVQGDSLKTTPKGYDKTHPEIQLLRRTQLYVIKSFTDQEVCSEDFSQKVVEGFKVMKPFLDYLNAILLEA